MKSRSFLISALLCCALLSGNTVFAADYAAKANQAATNNQTGYTIYVDVNFGMRKRSAADELNKAHQAFSLQKFEPISVVAHEENGDLLGFFVTYRKIQPK
jgi:hypothetical protein